MKNAFKRLLSDFLGRTSLESFEATEINGGALMRFKRGFKHDF